MTWQEHAACRGTPTDEFFPGPGANVPPALLLCRACPVRQNCLDFALEFDIRDGIYGGLSGNQRWKLRYRPGHVTVLCVSCSGPFVKRSESGRRHCLDCVSPRQRQREAS